MLFLALKDYDSVKLMSLADEARAFGEHSKVDDVKAHVMWHDNPFLPDLWPNPQYYSSQVRFQLHSFKVGLMICKQSHRKVFIL